MIRTALLFSLLLAGGCSDFEQYKLIRSPDGTVATMAVPSSGEGAYTLCLAEKPLKNCNRSNAILYVDRGRDVNIWWKDSNTLIVEQSGGDVRIRPPAEPIKIGSHMIRVELLDSV
jgi:hypothetical protein